MEKNVMVVIGMLAVLGLSGCGNDLGNGEDIAQPPGNPENMAITVEQPKEKSWQAEYSILADWYEQAVAAGNLYGYRVKE